MNVNYLPYNPSNITEEKIRILRECSANLFTSLYDSSFNKDEIFTMLLSTILTHLYYYKDTFPLFFREKLHEAKEALCFVENNSKPLFIDFVDILFNNKVSLN